MRLGTGHPTVIKVVDIINLSSSANTLLRNRVKMMRTSGIDNRIICMDGPYVRSLQEEGIPVETVHLPRGYNVLKLAFSLFQVAAYLRRENIDIVHTHCSIPGFIGRLAAWVVRVPVIIHTVHGFHFHERTATLKRHSYVLLERLAGLFVDALLSQNSDDMEEARWHRIVPPDRLHSIGNGIDLERFRPGMQLPPADGRVTITCVARLEAVKNHKMLFEAVRLLKERGERFKLWVIGDGELRLKYQLLCEGMEIDHLVHFLGYRDDIPELLAQTDIAVLTSIKEGVPRTVLEAMALGIPVVATRVKGTREVVQDGETGFTVQLGDSVGLAAKLSELMKDSALRAKMGRRGREIAVKRFDERAIVNSLRTIYLDLLSKKGIMRNAAIPKVVER